MHTKVVVQGTETATRSKQSTFNMSLHRKSSSIIDEHSSYQEIIRTIPIEVDSTQYKEISNSLTGTAQAEMSACTSSVPEMYISTQFTLLPIVTPNTIFTTQGTQSKSFSTLLNFVSSTYMSIPQPTVPELISSTSTLIMVHTSTSTISNLIDGMKSSSMTTRIKTKSVITTSFVMVTSFNGQKRTATPKLAQSSQVDSSFEVSASGIKSIADGLVLKTSFLFKESSHHAINFSSPSIKGKWILH